MIFCAAASRKAGGALPVAMHPEKLPVTGFQGGKLPEAAFLGIRQKDKRNREGSQSVITVILAILSGLSAVYGIITFLYSGINTVWLWAGLTAFFGALTWGNHYYLLHKKTVPMWIPVSAATFCCACLAIFVIIEGLIFLNASGNPVQNLDYVIVLGARVKKDGISRSLKERLDTAIQYSEENPETVFVLSGGKGQDEPVTEAEAMRDYMVYNGISPDRILLETHSTSTVENIAYSRLVIEEDRAKRKNRQEQKSETIMFSGSDIVMAPDKPTQVGILTSDFHIFRAKKIAKEWGIKDAAGIPSPSDPVLFVHQCVREALAIFKDRVMGNM